jgi:hypothetical protein
MPPSWDASRARADALIVACQGVALCPDLPPDGWYIERAPARLGYREAHQALYGLLRLTDRQRMSRLLGLASGDANELAATAPRTAAAIPPKRSAPRL